MIQMINGWGPICELANSDKYELGYTNSKLDMIRLTPRAGRSFRFRKDIMKAIWDLFLPVLAHLGYEEPDSWVYKEFTFYYEPNGDSVTVDIVEGMLTKLYWYVMADTAYERLWVTSSRSGDCQADSSFNRCMARCDSQGEAEGVINNWRWK